MIGCANCKRVWRQAVAYLTLGCRHEHVLVDHAACVFCLRMALRDAYCSRCRKAGCVRCPMNVVKVTDLDGNDVTGRPFILARQRPRPEKMIFGHTVPEPHDPKIFEGAPLASEGQVGRSSMPHS